MSYENNATSGSFPKDALRAASRPFPIPRDKPSAVSSDPEHIAGKTALPRYGRSRRWLPGKKEIRQHLEASRSRETVNSTSTAPAPQGQTTLYLHNLAPDVRPDTLLFLFESYGHIVESRFHIDCGLGYVKMDTHNNAALAIQNVNGCITNGRPLGCWWSAGNPFGEEMAPHTPPGSNAIRTGSGTEIAGHEAEPMIQRGAPPTKQHDSISKSKHEMLGRKQKHIAHEGEITLASDEYALDTISSETEIALKRKADENGWSILHQAVHDTDVKSLQLLLGRHLASLDAVDLEGKTALHHCCEFTILDALDKVRALLEYGADVNAED